MNIYGVKIPNSKNPLEFDMIITFRKNVIKDINASWHPLLRPQPSLRIKPIAQLVT